MVSSSQEIDLCKLVLQRKPDSINTDRTVYSAIWRKIPEPMRNKITYMFFLLLDISCYCFYGMVGFLGSFLEVSILILRLWITHVEYAQRSSHTSYFCGYSYCVARCLGAYKVTKSYIVTYSLELIYLFAYKMQQPIFTQTLSVFSCAMIAMEVWNIDSFALFWSHSVSLVDFLGNINR